MEKPGGENEEPEVTEEQNNAKTAFSFLQFAAVNLGPEERIKLKTYIVFFTQDKENFILLCKMLHEKARFSDEQVDKVLACLQNQQCRSQLIRMIGSSPIF